jgi:DNA-binding LacI/PurR family transcriptional regulator
VTSEATRRRTTITDVARRAGVSVGAVSFALNGRPGVGPATRTRILEAARELDWRPSVPARALSRSRALSLGLVMLRSPELIGADPFFPQFMAGVETTLAARGYSLTLLVATDQESETEGYRRLAGEGRVDGVFLTDLRGADRRFDLIRDLSLPAVAIGPPVPDCPFPSVSVDDSVGVRDAVRYLAALGHKRIGYVHGTPGYVHTESRHAAWRIALRDAGLRPGPVEAGDFTGPGGAKATRRLLKLPDPPTAIVYANDIMAISGIGAAHQLGVRVPEDLSVVGFDDVPLAAHVSPPLTTVRQEVVPWGRAAADVLVAVVEKVVLPQPVLDAPRLVVRKSTDNPRPTRKV